MSKKGRDHGKPSRLRLAMRRNVDRVRKLAARVVYRRSAGVVQARKNMLVHGQGASGTVRELARRSAARPDILGTLPLSYRHLFAGQININESFFLCRDELVAEGVEALSPARNTPRTVLVTGDRGSGKTTLCQQIATRAGRAVWLSPPIGGGSGAAELKTALQTALATAGVVDSAARNLGQPIQQLARLPANTIIVMDDIDLWWERRTGGLEAIEELMRWVSVRGDDIGFLMAGSSHAVRLLDQLRHLTRAAHTHLVCQPLAAQDLQSIIMTRHQSTGVRLRVGRRGRDHVWCLVAGPSVRQSLRLQQGQRGICSPRLAGARREVRRRRAVGTASPPVGLGRD